MNETRVEMIRQRLEQALSPASLEIIDDSHKHIGHAGAASGAGHFTVKISAKALTGKTRIQQHQSIYQALADMMPAEIHALSIKVLQN
ncbi:BolA family protein [Piscirickettsia litoralis]|uniref:Cell division protein BolA n=1 Tax=Piscirickettsia litoralis TaxID=1891921 RepID=A0ABX3A3G8_9GAMM|nr:BolA family protein [Piscirickettsia litoralis]ODN43411.1 cell division protein BolA [Piscirickettsia litoralis]